MSFNSFWHERNRFRLMLFRDKAVEVGVVCLLVMVKGHIGDVTVTHLVIATKPGLLTVCPAYGVTFTRYARHFVNKWWTSGFIGVCTFFADSLMHKSHFTGRFTDAILTAIGAFIFTTLVSYTRLGKEADRLAESFLDRHIPVASSASEPNTMTEPVTEPKPESESV